MNPVDIFKDIKKGDFLFFKNNKCLEIARCINASENHVQLQEDIVVRNIKKGDVHHSYYNLPLCAGDIIKINKIKKENYTSKIERRLEHHSELEGKEFLIENISNFRSGRVIFTLKGEDFDGVDGIVIWDDEMEFEIVTKTIPDEIYDYFKLKRLEDESKDNKS